MENVSIGPDGKKVKPYWHIISKCTLFFLASFEKKCLIGLSYLFRLRWWRRPSMMRRLPVTTAITGGKNPKILFDCSNTTLSKRCSTSYKTTYEAQQEEECGENFKWVNCVICRSSDQEDLHCSGMVCFTSVGLKFTNLFLKFQLYFFFVLLFFPFSIAFIVRNLA